MNKVARVDLCSNHTHTHTIERVNSKRTKKCSNHEMNGDALLTLCPKRLD